jgi:uncharacterized membrane protein YhaH (DUF805 family)
MSATPPPSGAPAAAPAQRRQWDLLLTVALLAIGAITVFATFGELADLAGTIDETYRLQGIDGRLEARDAASTVGFVVNVIRVAALLWAAAVAIRRLRAGQLAFWVPLTAGVVANLALMIGVASIILGDPAFLAYVDSIATTGVVPTPTP